MHTDQVVRGTEGLDVAAELLRTEYLEALLSGDPLTEVSTPGLAVESMTIIRLLWSMADVQVATLHGCGAIE